MTVHALDGVRPRVPASAWVAPSADVVGDVALGEAATVWFGAVLRADTSTIAIGRGSNVQDGAVCHSDPGEPLTVGAGVTVGHNAILHGCTIGDNVLVGMGATVLNGAVVAADCVIGAGALVTQGKRFEAGQLIVGAPAKAVRPLSADEIARNRRSAEGYVARGARFRAGLSPA